MALSLFSNLAIVLVVDLAAVWSATGCEYAIVGPKHTLCTFAEKACPNKKLFRSGKLSCDEKQEILDVHNGLRQMLANGLVPNQPAAINLREMTWDDELATIAQRWADQCKRGHDVNRNVVRFFVGQNVASTWTFKHFPRATGDRPDFRKQIHGWFDEVKAFNASHINPFHFESHLGHYTQIAWSETFLVGCGYTFFKDPKRGFTKLYVCNYGPAGNLIEGVMYERRVSRAQPTCDDSFLQGSPKFPDLCRPRGVEYDLQKSCNVGALVDEGAFPPGGNDGEVGGPPELANHVQPGKPGVSLEPEQEGDVLTAVRDGDEESPPRGRPGLLPAPRPHTTDDMMVQLVRSLPRMVMTGLRPLMNLAHALNPFNLVF